MRQRLKKQKKQKELQQEPGLLQAQLETYQGHQKPVVDQRVVVEGQSQKPASVNEPKTQYQVLLGKRSSNRRLEIH
jgi:hypothetical protein